MKQLKVIKTRKFNMYYLDEGKGFNRIKKQDRYWMTSPYRETLISESKNGDSIIEIYRLDLRSLVK